MVMNLYLNWNQTMTPDWTKPKIDEQQLGQFSDKPKKPKEVNGPKGLEPTRYGDWERKGICYDF